MIKKLSVLKTGLEEKESESESEWFVSTIKGNKYWVKYAGIEFDTLHIRGGGITSAEVKDFENRIMSLFEEAERSSAAYSKGKYPLSQEWVVAPSKNKKKGMFLVGFKLM